jgi:hypothetical protein
MTASRPRMLAVRLAIGVLGAPAIAGVSYGAAVAGTFTDASTTVLHFTGDAARGFHAQGSTTHTIRVELIDGRSTEGTLISHHSESASAHDTYAYTAIVHGTVTLDGSDGRPLGPVTAHQVSHVTYRAGELEADVDRLRSPADARRTSVRSRRPLLP